MSNSRLVDHCRRAYAQVRRFRLWIEYQGAHVLTVPKSEMLGSMQLQRRRAHTVITELDESAWQPMN